MTDNPWKIPQVAAAIGCSRQAVRDWCNSGKGPRHRRTPGGKRLFDPADVAAWIEEHSVKGKNQRAVACQNAERPIGCQP
jgi:predicted DNA-binding transcriptional regulator AlpA